MKNIRLGRKTDGKMRPVLVKLENEKMKWAVIVSAKKLKESDSIETKSIGITLDMTKEEREQNKKLREELAEKRRQGGRWIIKKRKIMNVEEN